MSLSKNLVQERLYLKNVILLFISIMLLLFLAILVCTNVNAYQRVLITLCLNPIAIERLGCEHKLSNYFAQAASRGNEVIGANLISLEMNTKDFPRFTSNSTLTESFL